MASIILRPTSGSGSGWNNIGNAYDGNESTNASVSVSLWSSPRTLTLNFDTSVIPSGATINSATLTLRSKAGKTTITANVDINGDEGSRVINKKQSTSATNYTADVASYMSDLTSVNVVVNNSNWSGNTFELYELWIDVDYTASTTSTTYTVTFKDWDGTVLKTQTVASGGAASAPADPTREGYTFTGWDKDYNNVTSDLVVTAQYAKNPIITFTQNSGGYVLCNGTKYVGNSTVSVQRGSNVNITVYANENYYIKSIQMSDFEDLIEDPNARETTFPFGFENINTDEKLTIEYARVDGTEEPPTTPSTSNILIGNNRVNKIYIGNTSISKVYLGNTRLL